MTAPPPVIEIKDIVLGAGVVVTLLLGLFNLYFNLRAGKRAAFVNTVTNERVKWISKVRGIVSELCALSDEWMRSGSNMELERQKQMFQLQDELRLMMNPSDPLDLQITGLLDRFPSWTYGPGDEFQGTRKALISATQVMLKREWDKVKDEAVRGDLRNS
ncbi:hypothetical protein [Acidovorax sp. 99]|uniref:hypothetical protein n=1 Tax=Acidovorax sp. 99 TaxID=2135634 RepID=UPI001057A59C|nr:hypothetical protein [Acidovorax sp. 99]